jgi:hypothetical protein
MNDALNTINSNDPENKTFLVNTNIESVTKMPCGSKHSCFHCNSYYFGCTWLNRMSEEEYEKHEQIIHISK